jgi:rare lipoprotein A
MPFSKILFAGFFFLLGLGMSAQVQSGKASYYADHFKGRRTASGEKYDPKLYTAAHRTHPFGTWIQVTNTKNGKSVLVKVNDRGPFVQGRVVDLSRAAAEEIGMIAAGTANVTVQLADSAMLASLLDTAQAVTPTPAPPPSAVLRVVSLTPSPTDWCVEAATFTQADSLLAVSARVERDLREVVLITHELSQGQLTYHLIVSQYPTQEEAERVRQKLLPQFPLARTVQFSKVAGK